MTATAKPRLPPINVCRRSMRGHVATTIVTAQTKAGRNGLRMKKLATMRATKKITTSIVPVRSREGGVLVIGKVPLQCPVESALRPVSCLKYRRQRSIKTI